MASGYITFRFQNRLKRKDGIDGSQAKYKYSANGYKRESISPGHILREAYKDAVDGGDFKREEEFLHIATTADEILALPRNDVATIHPRTVRTPFAAPMSVGGVPEGYKSPPEESLTHAFGIKKTANFRICCSIDVPILSDTTISVE